MFLASGCPNTGDPDPKNLTRGPFCRDCLSSNSSVSILLPPSPSSVYGTDSNITRPRLSFRSRQLLIDAVDAYLADSSPTSEVALVFGYPIGSWNVSQIDNISFVFDSDRNPSTKTFDEDLSGWDTSAAKSMVQTFAGASLFNGNISSWSTHGVTNMSGMCKLKSYETRARWNTCV